MRHCRGLMVGLCLGVSLSSCSPVTSRDDLESTIRKELNPAQFTAAAIDPSAIEHYSSLTGHELLTRDQLVNLNLAAARDGNNYELVEFKMLNRHDDEDVASITYLASIAQTVSGKRTLLKFSSDELWEHQVNGWVFIAGVSRELPVPP